MPAKPGEHRASDGEPVRDRRHQAAVDAELDDFIAAVLQAFHTARQSVQRRALGTLQPFVELDADGMPLSIQLHLLQAEAPISVPLVSLTAIRMPALTALEISFDCVVDRVGTPAGQRLALRMVPGPRLWGPAGVHRLRFNLTAGPGVSGELSLDGQLVHRYELRDDMVDAA